MTEIEYFLADEVATLILGKQLANALPSHFLMFLIGNLGAGKTTFVRGILQGLGYVGHVKSPTYTLIEPYQIGTIQIAHFDLYRVVDPLELSLMGFEEYLEQRICLLEWPERGGDRLPQADLSCYIRPSETGRQMRLVANTLRGQTVIQALADKEKY